MKNITSKGFKLMAFLPAMLAGLLSFVFFSLKPIIAEKHFVTLGDHLTLKNIAVHFKSLGGFEGNCMELGMENLTPETLFVTIEPGRRLVANDSIYQDILLVKEKQVVLYPHAKTKITGVGFCCQSHDMCPAKDSTFSAGYMAPAGWIELAKVINENNFPQDAVQNAIWIISNNHPMASMFNPDMEKIKLLRETVAKIKGITLPWYSITYEADSTKLFSNKPEIVRGKFNYSVSKNAMITANIKSKSGMVMTTLIEGVASGPGKFTYDLELPVKNWPKGEYTISVYEDFSNLNSVMKFEL